MQLSKLLSHHSPAFTLTVYAFLLNGDVGEPLDLDAELVAGDAVPGAAPEAVTHDYRAPRGSELMDGTASHETSLAATGVVQAVR